MSGILAFIEARLADDERFIRVMSEAGQRTAANATPRALAAVRSLIVQLMSDPACAEEIGRWESAGFGPPTGTDRVSADIAVKRDMLALHKPNSRDMDRWTRCLHCNDTYGDYRTYPCPDIRLLAASWREHPEYDPSWAPQ